MNAIEPLRTLPVLTLNLGSGKDFRADAFNIDIDDSWGPDAVLDLSAIDLREGGITLRTERFGLVTLAPGSFERIVANDVLEHVPNLMKLMTTCLGLLRLGGRFEISVPYDLSHGAWQDPTHVRAFNERSWLYYTDWFWYMGWSEARFALEHLQFVPSPAGAEMQRQGHPLAAVITTPRAVDSMSVVLRKIELSAADRATWQQWRDRRKQAQAARAPAVPVAAPMMPAARPEPLAARSALAGPWSGHADRYCIWIVTPKEYDHHHAFDEVAIALSEAFAERGGSAPVVRHPSAWKGRVPIILGAHLLTKTLTLILPPESVVFNVEQVDRASSWMSEPYLALLRAHPVLDYSRRNTAALHAAGFPHARCLPFGYSAGLSRIPAGAPKDIDVLFYGSVNERRAAVLTALQARGCTVTHLFGVYGADRDAAVARARIVLNLHFYEAAIFESARVVDLLANGACVVTEGVADDPDLAPFADGLAVCGYDELVSRCLALLADEPARAALSARALAAAMASPQAAGLAALCDAG